MNTKTDMMSERVHFNSLQVSSVFVGLKIPLFLTLLAAGGAFAVGLMTVGLLLGGASVWTPPQTPLQLYSVYYKISSLKNYA